MCRLCHSTVDQSLNDIVRIWLSPTQTKTSHNIGSTGSSQLTKKFISTNSPYSQKLSASEHMKSTILTDINTHSYIQVSDDILVTVQLTQLSKTVYTRL